MQHERYMELAIQEAQKARQAGELPFGAVVVRGGKVISKGRCREKRLSTVLAHAEAEAVDKACKKLGTTKLTDCVIYCTNEPCPMCAAAIFQAKVPCVVIGASRTDITFLRPRKVDIVLLAEDSGFSIELIRDVKKGSVLALFKEVNM